MDENKKFDVSFEDNKLMLSLDTNQDGEKLIKAKLSLSEAVEEAFKKGVAIEGAKVVDFSFSGASLMLKLDTDKDGEELLELEINLMEALDEVGVLK